ncbi:hypothetical protein WR25_05649 [Diploscapter pachys]|uniref:Calcineurin-like phosphoesterase domain-containing protein n=1 Tax=Diploscapter pachys TaxID=2018661 RepID=A0A2A2KRN3_9BILA|nr:hypothetical protein WR25_05649 [Diploscapter pachys]
MIYISGDNDVGGEHEFVDSKLVERFRRIFPDFINTLKNSFTITEVNLMSGARVVRNVSSPQNSRLHILLSHPPYLPFYSGISPIKDQIDLILSAHDHTSHTHEKQGRSLETKNIDSSRPQERLIGNGRPPFEIQFPTCSYR